MPAVKAGATFAWLLVTISDAIFHPLETLSDVFHMASLFNSPLRSVIDFKPHSDFKDVKMRKKSHRSENQ